MTWQSPYAAPTSILPEDGRKHTKQTAISIAGFLVRHLLAATITVVAVCAIWTLAYLGLLLWAIVTNSGLGSPIAYPVGLIAAFFAGSIACLFFLLPSTAIAEWVAQRRGFPILAQIFINMVILAVLCLVAVGIKLAVRSVPSFRSLAIQSGVLFLTLLIPLGIYWWSARLGSLLLSLFHRGNHATRKS